MHAAGYKDVNSGLIHVFVVMGVQSKPVIGPR